MKKQLTFYFVRHGRTAWNDAGLLQGGGDSPLTAAGIADAKATALALQSVDFAAAYSSNLTRAIDTTTLILAQRPIPQFQHRGLNEQFFGSWEGQKISELRQLAEFQTMSHDPLNYQARSCGGETYQALLQRSRQAVQDIIAVHQQGNILVVSHGHTLRLLLHVLAGGCLQQHRDPTCSPSILNTAITQFEYWQTAANPSGSFELIKLNDVTHLQSRSD